MKMAQVIAIKPDGTEREIARTTLAHAKHYLEWLRSNAFKAAVQKIKDAAATKGVEPKFLDVEDCIFVLDDFEGEGS